MRLRLCVLSTCLPLLSHVVRQAVSCRKVPPVPEYTFAVFLAVYSVCLMVHGTWMSSPLVSKAQHACFARGATVLFVVTFLGAVKLARASSAWFTVAFALHAVPSAAMWPLAYGYVTRLTRNRTLLALWSLQGTIGDGLGCLASDLLFRPACFPLVAGAACAAGIAVAVGIPRVPVPLGCAETDAEMVNGASERLVASDSHPARSVGAFPRRLLLAVFASAAIKSSTYTLSNYLPTTHGRFYSTYVVCSGLGTVCAGIGADACAAGGALSVAVASFALAGLTAASLSWDTTAAAGAVGVTTAMCSTAVSVCVCTDIAERTGRFEFTTAVLDGAATLMAGVVQLWGRRDFDAIQRGCAGALVVASVLLLMESSAPYRRGFLRPRVGWCCLRERSAPSAAA